MTECEGKEWPRDEDWTEVQLCFGSTLSISDFYRVQKCLREHLPDDLRDKLVLLCYEGHIVREQLKGNG